MLEFAELALTRLNERKHWLIIYERQAILRDALVAWKRSLPTLGGRYLPSISDVCNLQCARDVLDQDDNVQVTEASFAEVIKLMPEIADGLQEQISDCLAGKFLSHGPHENLNLAKNVLICKNCQEVLRRSSYFDTVRTRAVNTGPFWPAELYTHPCANHNKHGYLTVMYDVGYDWSRSSHIPPSPVMALANSINCDRTPWDKNCALQDTRASHIALTIVRMAGQDPETTTVEEMDNLGALFECEECSRSPDRLSVDGHLGSRLLVNWRRIVSFTVWRIYSR